MIAVDLCKQQALDADPRTTQQINFAANLDRAGNTRTYFILEEAKETILDFAQGTVKVLRLSSNVIGNSDDETNFPHKLLLTGRQVANLRKSFANHTSTDIKLSKAQLTKMQKGGFLRFLAPLLKSGLPLLKSVNKQLGMLRLTAAALATDAAINKKIIGSGNHTTLIIYNDDMQDLLK